MGIFFPANYNEYKKYRVYIRVRDKNIDAINNEKKDALYKAEKTRSSKKDKELIKSQEENDNPVERVR